MLLSLDYVISQFNFLRSFVLEHNPSSKSILGVKIWSKDDIEYRVSYTASGAIIAKKITDFKNRVVIDIDYDKEGNKLRVNYFSPSFDAVYDAKTGEVLWHEAGESSLRGLCIPSLESVYDLFIKIKSNALEHGSFMQGYLYDVWKTNTLIYQKYYNDNHEIKLEIATNVDTYIGISIDYNLTPDITTIIYDALRFSVKYDAKTGNPLSIQIKEIIQNEA